MQPADLLALLEPILSAPTIEAAGAETARQLGPATNCLTLGFFVVMHGRPFLEFWYPEDRVKLGEVEHHLQRLALESAAKGEPVVEPLPDGSGLMPKVHMLPLQERLTGVLCFVMAPSADANGAASPNGRSVWDQVAQLIAIRLRAVLEVEAERRRSGQYERWFRVTDKQIRALDLERQKFAGLVNAIQVGVFVADRDRVIRWNSRPLLGLFPVPEEGSWVGQSCEQLCRQMTPGHGACSDCMVARVLRERQPAGCIVRLGPAGTPVRVNAIPISDLDGQPHEVMVAFQELSQAGDELAA